MIFFNWEILKMVLLEYLQSCVQFLMYLPMYQVKLFLKFYYLKKCQANKMACNCKIQYYIYTHPTQNQSLNYPELLL